SKGASVVNSPAPAISHSAAAAVLSTYNSGSQTSNTTAQNTTNLTNTTIATTPTAATTTFTTPTSGSSPVQASTITGPAVIDLSGSVSSSNTSSSTSSGLTVLQPAAVAIVLAQRLS